MWVNNIFLVIVLLGTLIFVYFFQGKRDNAEKMRFREFVLASKSKDVKEYIETLPEEGEVVYEEEDELVDLDNVEADTLIKAIRNENADR